MSSTKPVLLILGSGANIGQSVARTFSAKGYQVAATSRSEKPTQNGAPADGIDLHIKSDLADPRTVPGVFQQVRETLGQAPSVVVYNGELLSSNHYLALEGTFYIRPRTTLTTTPMHDSCGIDLYPT